jgi:NAD(P)-dependent dehydrogenase (short-subunit alcohol dehydrogenase family)
MIAILHALGMFAADLFKSRNRLEAENLFLRHQLNIALRHLPSRLRLRGVDRALLVWINCQPGGRFIPLENVAAIVAFLCRPQSQGITGSVFPVDGGWAVS